MKKGKDISAKFGGLYLVHQNIPGKKTSDIIYPQHILFIPLQGEIKIETSDAQIGCGLGQMLYLPPNTKHSFSSSESFGERLIVMIDKNSFLSDASSPTKLVLNQLVKEVLFYLLLHPKTKAAKSLVSVFIETLSESLEKTLSEADLDHLEGKIKDLRVKNVLEFFKDNLSEELSMSSAGEKAGLSLRNLNRLVLKETGLTPKQWLIHFRIEKAKELLKVPRASVTDVAFSVGYNSLSQFIATFRSKTGQLPSEFLRHG